MDEQAIPPASEPLELDWFTPEPDEEVLWASRMHRSALYSSLAISLPFVLVLVGIAFVAGSWLWYQNTHYVVTDRRIYAKRGVLSRNVKTIDFEKVQNINYRQGPLGAQFGYGTVEISTAGSSDVELAFRSVPDPAAVQELIDREINRGRNRGRDRGEASDRTDDPEAVLAEILEELRAIRGLLEDEAARDRTAGKSARTGEPTSDGSTRSSEPQSEPDGRDR